MEHNSYYNVITAQLVMQCSLHKSKDHYCLHKIQPLNPILSLLNPGSTGTTYVCKIVLILSFQVHIVFRSDTNFSTNIFYDSCCISKACYISHLSPSLIL
jgi:hypothetical protein